MSRLGPIRLTLRGLRVAPGVAALVALLVLAGTLLAVGGPRATTAVLTSALQDDLAPASGPIALSADVARAYFDPKAGSDTTTLWTSLPSQLRGIRASSFGADGVVEPGRYVGYATGPGGGFPGSGTPTTPPQITTAFTLEGAPSLHADARLVAGRWPRAVGAGRPVEVVVAAKSAAVLRWRIGQTQSLGGASPSGSRDVTLVGTVAPRDPADAFWGLRASRADVGSQQALGSDTVLHTATLWVDDASWPGLAATLPSPTISVWFGIDVRELTADRAPAVATAIRRSTVKPVTLGHDGAYRLSFHSDLPGDLDDFAAHSAPSVALVALFALGPAGALAAVLLLGLRLLQSRRTVADGLLAARGGSEAQRRLLGAATIAIWSVPAAAVGTAVAVLLTPGLGSWLAAVPGGALCALAAPVAAALLAERTAGRDDRSLASRAVGPIASIVVVLVAVLALVVLVARGPTTAASGIDPIVEAAPLLLALAVTVVLLRVVPTVGRRVAGLQRRGRSPVGLVAATSTGLARRGGAWALFALVVGVGMSVFSLTMVATQQHGVTQAALNRTGADVAIGGAQLPDGTVRAIARLPGVAAHAAISVVGQEADVTVYAVDHRALASVQRGIDASPLLDAQGTEALASSANDAGSTATLDATRGELHLHRVPATAVTFVFTEPHWILVDRARLQPDAETSASTMGLLLRLRPGADPDAVATAARHLAGGDATVRTAAAAEDGIVGSPLDHAVRTTILGATILTALLCLVVFVMTLAAGAAERLRRGAILRALGFDRRQTAALVVADVTPPAIAGAVAGLLTGIGLAAAVLPAVDPTGFVGAPLAPALVVDPPTTLLALVAFLAAAALAAAVAVALDLSRPATAGLQPLGEER